MNVFGKQLHDEKHPHLKNFYLIIPPLTINYVDHMIAAKEKLNKNNFDGAAFTDDGLVMGRELVMSRVPEIRVLGFGRSMAKGFLHFSPHFFFYNR